MTQEEMVALFEDVTDYIYNNRHRSYHDWYYPHNDFTWGGNNTYLSFEVEYNNDKGSSWTETWSIYDDGSISDGENKYEDLETFKSSW